MDFEQDARPDKPPSISPPKRHRKISFDENSANVQRPSKKPRSNCTPLADRSSYSRYTSVRPGECSFAIASLNLSFFHFCFLFRVVTGSPGVNSLIVGVRYSVFFRVLSTLKSMQPVSRAVKVLFLGSPWSVASCLCL